MIMITFEDGATALLEKTGDQRWPLRVIEGSFFPLNTEGIEHHLLPSEPAPNTHLTVYSISVKIERPNPQQFRTWVTDRLIKRVEEVPI